jgi:hypothetical protein
MTIPIDTPPTCELCGKPIDECEVDYVYTLDVKTGIAERLPMHPGCCDEFNAEMYASGHKPVAFLDDESN